ncbi:MAG TPA: hypothetical protein VK642_10435 [Burkholderiales bacterium]|nr:hypothetical protein [Burkholderiales bacterium]
MLRAFAIGAAICAISISAFAQNNLVGKWGGSFEFTGGSRDKRPIGVDVEITSVEGDVVKGVARNYALTCGGEYQIAGKLEGNDLRMASPQTGGGTNDCRFGFRVVVDGTKMTGKIGNYNLTLNKK